MTAVMERPAGRPAEADEPEIETGIFVVPMELVGQYYATQIASEGPWHDDPPILVTGPPPGPPGAFRADDAWFRHTLAQMRQVRRPGTKRYVFPREHDRDFEIDIDVGLIDVQLYFEASPAGRFARSMDERHQQYTRNHARFVRLCGGQLHNQMVIATAVHQYRPDGSYAPHFHNVIFALRKQMEPDEHIGILELLPVIKALGDGRTMNIMEEL
jgi:hypothetical protein